MRLFTHLIVEAKNRHAYNLKPYAHTHDVVGHVEAFSHVRSSYKHFPPLRIKSKPALFILKNKRPPLLPDFSALDRKKKEETVLEEAGPTEEVPEALLEASTPVEVSEVVTEASSHDDSEQLPLEIEEVKNNQSETENVHHE